MDSTDAAELIAELSEDKEQAEVAERFRNRAALLIAFLAGILAIAGLGGGNATDDLIGNNIRSADAWAFYQAKNMRQTIYTIASEEIEAVIADPGTSPHIRASAEQRLARYKAAIARYESEPDPEAPDDPLRGEGKKQLRAQALSFEEGREQAAARDDNFDLAETFLQLALVLGSVAILALSRWTLILSAALGALGAFLTANGFFLLAPLPI